MDINQQGYIDKVSAKYRQYHDQLRHNWRKLKDNTFPEKEPQERSHTYQALDEMKAKLHRLRNATDEDWQDLRHDLDNLIQEIEPKFY